MVPLLSIAPNADRGFRCASDAPSALGLFVDFASNAARHEARWRAEGNIADAEARHAIADKFSGSVPKRCPSALIALLTAVHG